jgi:uncharacterized protein (TIGR02145 family)
MQNGQGAPLLDARDDQIYATIIINSQTWMAENLNYAVDGSKCYEDSNSNCAQYGRLYDWETARNACPTGWHLPDEKEWTKLAVATGNGGNEAARKLKATSGWSNSNGTNDYGFSALPGGVFGRASLFSPDFSFLDIGNGGYWWSATDLEYDGDIVGMGVVMVSQYENVIIKMAYDKSYLLSVRCLKN